MITVLITGSNGQLGSELKELSKNYPEYNFMFTTKETLPINDKVKLRSFFQNNFIDYCVNCAAFTNVDAAEKSINEAFNVNADAVEKLAYFCDATDIKLIHISTDYVYGDQSEPLKETDRIYPANVYGLSKLYGEKFIRKNDQFNNSLIIRTSWLYSQYGGNFVKTMLRLFKEKETINVVNDQTGCPTYAADLAGIIMNIIEKESDPAINCHGTINYCGSGATSWYDFAIAIKELTGSACEIVPVSSNDFAAIARRPKNSVMDTTRIKEKLGITIPHWKDSLKICLDKIAES